MVGAHFLVNLRLLHKWCTLGPMSERPSGTPELPPDDKPDIFAAFLTELNPDATLSMASLLRQESELGLFGGSDPVKKDMLQLDRAELPEHLQAELHAITIFVLNIYKFTNHKKRVLNVPIPQIVYSADICVQIDPKTGPTHRRKVTMDVGDIFPMALFNTLDPDLTTAPVFRVKSIERDVVTIVPVNNPKFDAEERDS